jgi:hypothetical protein
MKRLHAWLTGAAGGVAAYRLFRRRRDEVEEQPVEAVPEPDLRAEELRAKLAEARVEEPEPVTEPAAEESPEERRRRVHEQARGALDEMQGE